MNIIIEEIISEFPVVITEEVFVIKIADSVSYFELTEVADTDFVGKDGYVPVVDEAAGKLVLSAQTAGPGGGVPEAPNNSNAYVRSALSWVVSYTKTAIDNLLNGKFNNPSGNNTQYLDGAGNPTTFPNIPSISGLATETYVDNGLSNKVDKLAGKGLSTEDYTTAEKNKLSGIDSGATANDTDANLKNRANHTGTQLSSTISDFVSQVGGLITTALASFKTDNFLDATSSIQGQLDGKLMDNAWINFGASSTINGFSSISTRNIWYKDFNDVTLYIIDIVGISVNNTFTFTIPQIPNFSMQLPCGQGTSNGTISNTVALAIVNSGSNVIDLRFTPQGSSWGVANTKGFKGQFFIKK